MMSVRPSEDPIQSLDDPPENPTPSSRPVLRFRPLEPVVDRPDRADQNSEAQTGLRKNQDGAQPILRSELRAVEVRPPSKWIKVLQKWECEVLDVRGADFDARLQDLTNPDLADELVTLSIEEVPPADRDLLVQGGMFFWIVGYRDSIDGGRQRVSEIRFRRLPFTQQQIESARKLGRETATRLGWR